MRRCQFDQASQPFRNLLLNPSGEAISGSLQTVATNFFRSPQAELLSGPNIVIRTNWAPDPRQASAGSLGGYGSQTMSQVTGITDHPLGITTATRVTYGTAANPGPLIMIAPKPSTRYTMSAYVFHETIGANAVSGFALKGVNAVNLGSPTAGVWKRETWTYTTPATVLAGQDFGFRVTAQTSAGSYLINGILIEESNVLNDYYDGSSTAIGDFTFAWTGTVGNSPSTINGKGVTNWGSPSSQRAAAISSTEWSVNGTRSVRIIPTQANDGTTNASYAEISVAGLTVGKTYYILGTNRTTQALTGTLSSDYRRVFYPGTQPSSFTHHSGVPSNTGGNVYNYVGSFVAAASFHNIRLNNGAPEAPGNDVWWDAVAISDGATYFDGTMGTALDYTYSWTGTAGDSTSIQRATLVPNFVQSGSSGVYQSNLWASSGNRSIRIVNIPGSTIPESVIADHTTLLKPGMTYTLLGKLRLISVGANTHSRSRRINLYVSTNGGANYTETNGTQSPNAVGVYDHRFIFTIPSNATHMILRLGGNSYGDLRLTQSDAWWDDLMLVEGAYYGDYIDGTKQLAKWDGTANASSSVGYAPQFLDIAGKPVIDILGVGSVPNTGVPDPFGPRTFYSVHESVNNTAAYDVCASYGVVGSKGFMVQTAGAGSASMANRFDLPGGSFNGGIVMSARSTRRHVQAFSFNQGLTSSVSCANGNADLTIAVTPGTTGWDDSSARAVSLAETKNIRFIVFNAFHDRATRVAVSRYLGNKYGANVA